MRLIRTLLVLGGAAAFLPSPPTDPQAETGGRTALEVSAFEMLAQVTSAVSDVAGFCGRQPGACETAALVAAHVEAKAKYNAKLVYEWAIADEVPSGQAMIPVEAPAADPLQTGSTTPALHVPAPLRQSTLQDEDLIPPWRSPAIAGQEG